MKNVWIWVVVIVLVLGGGYFYRHQIKLLFSGYSSPVSTTTYAPTGSTASTAPTGAILSWVTGSSGQYAVGSNGMTLYIFDKDTKGVSNCSGSCAGVWPAYVSATTPASLPANVTLIKKADGSMQFAYKGMPLYYYSGDQKVGDVTGDGVGGIWHLVKP